MLRKFCKFRWLHNSLCRIVHRIFNNYVKKKFWQHVTYKVYNYVRYNELQNPIYRKKFLTFFFLTFRTKIESSKIHEVVYGFDMEWPVTFIGKSKKTALIQICTDHSTCYLFHVSVLVF